PGIRGDARCDRGAQARARRRKRLRIRRGEGSIRANGRRSVFRQDRRQNRRIGRMHMLNMTVPWWEIVVRSLVVYVFLLTILRITGKRQVGQLAPFDLVLLLVLSNAVQNSMTGGDNSLVGGIIAATTLISINWLIGYATFRNKRLE